MTRIRNITKTNNRLNNNDKEFVITPLTWFLKESDIIINAVL